MILARRKFLIGAAASLLAAPAIVRVGSLMPVRSLTFEPVLYGHPWLYIREGILLTLEELMRSGLLPPVAMEVGA